MKIEFAGVSTDSGLKGLNLAFGLNRLTILHDPAEELSPAILSALAGQDVLMEGQILIDGEPLSDKINGKLCSRTFGYVFDEGIMLANLSLMENLLLPLRWQNPGFKDEELQALIAPWMQLFEIDLDLSLRPASVKAAARKCLSYVRAIILKPEYLLIDDPYYYLNKVERGIMYRALSEMRLTQKMLIASSDDDFAAQGWGEEVVRLYNI